MRAATKYAVERMCADVAQIRKLMEGGTGKTGCDFCREYVPHQESFSLATHQGKQVVATFRFCPICGRKL